MEFSSRRRMAGLGLFAAGAALAGLTVWAVVTVTQPAKDPLESPSYTLVTVVEGEVGASIQLNTLAEWTSSPIGVNRASGVVTSVNVDAGAEVTQGSTIYTVDLRPVVVARGAVPAFRPIGDGTKGEDVRQVQQMLTDLGFYNGEVGGEAGSVTAAAIRDWQKSLGQEPTGVVEVGDIIFVPQLPARVSVDGKVVYPGTSLVSGEQVLAGLPASPVFTVPATETQAAMMPSGTRVEITSPSGAVWVGVVVEHKRDTQSGTTNAILAGLDGAIICGDSCDEVPVTGQLTLSSKVVTVETVQGLIVPSSALISTADGQLAVVDEAGQRFPVTVTAAARGESVIEGVPAGTKVRVPGQAQR